MTYFVVTKNNIDRLLSIIISRVIHVDLQVFPIDWGIHHPEGGGSNLYHGLIFYELNLRKLKQKLKNVSQRAFPRLVFYLAVQPAFRSSEAIKKNNGLLYFKKEKSSSLNIYSGHY